MAMRQDARTILQRGVILVGGQGDGKTSIIKLLTEGCLKEEPVATSKSKRYCCVVEHYDMVINLTDTVGIQTPERASEIAENMQRSSMAINCVFYVWKHHRRGFTNFEAKDCCIKLSKKFGENFRLIVTHAPEVKPEKVSEDLKSTWGENSSECKATRVEMDPGKILCIENCNYTDFESSDRKNLASRDADEAYKKLTGLIYSMDDQYSTGEDDFRNRESGGGCVIF